MCDMLTVFTSTFHLYSSSTSMVYIDIVKLVHCAASCVRKFFSAQVENIPKLAESRVGKFPNAFCIIMKENAKKILTKFCARSIS